jgi:hypothetical protein
VGKRVNRIRSSQIGQSLQYDSLGAERIDFREEQTTLSIKPPITVFPITACRALSYGIVGISSHSTKYLLYKIATSNSAPVAEVLENY